MIARKKHVGTRKSTREQRLGAMHRDVLDVDGAAEVLGVSRWTILKLARKGQLPAKKVGKEWRFRLQTLLRWLGDGSESRGRPEPVEEAISVLRGMGYGPKEAEGMVARAVDVVGAKGGTEALVKEAVSRES